MFFINIVHESKVQVADRFRIDCKNSSGISSDSPVTKLEIQPEATESFIQVSDNLSPLDSDKWFLDWEYSTAGVKTITVKFTFANLTTKTQSISCECITEVGDALFSTDDDLKLHEDDILKFLKSGKTSFKNFHRRSQSMILAELDRKGFRLEDKSKITKEEILDKSEVNEWSIYVTLSLIFGSISNANDDIFYTKSETYRKKSLIASDKTFLCFDYNKDGLKNDIDVTYIGSIGVFR